MLTLDTEKSLITGTSTHSPKENEVIMASDSQNKKITLNKFRIEKILSIFLLLLFLNFLIKKVN
jgi:hypothetical protein